MVLNVSEKLLEMLQDSDMALFFLILIYVHFLIAKAFFSLFFFLLVLLLVVLFCLFFYNLSSFINNLNFMLSL